MAERVYRTRTFSRWMRKADLRDDLLAKAVAEMKNGLFDANLGGNLVKKRVALHGQGKRGGARTIVATNWEQTWIFLYGFNKNERTNIDEADWNGALQSCRAKSRHLEG